MSKLKLIGYLIAVFIVFELLFRVFNPFGIGYFNYTYKYFNSCYETGNGYYLSGDMNEANSSGLRGNEIYSKDRKRILLIGDSVVWGMGVANNKTFSYQLQCMLPEYEVINAGIGGWNTENEYQWLKCEGLDLEPDIVILYITANDVENIFAGRVPDYPIWQKVCYNSYVLSTVFYIKRNVFRTLFGRTGLRKNTTNDGYDIAEQAFRGIAELTGEKLIVCMYGCEPAQRTQVMQFYLGLVKELKIPTFFLPENVYEPKYRNSTIDHHMNRLGHKVIAQITNKVIMALYEQNR